MSIPPPMIMMLIFILYTFISSMGAKLPYDTLEEAKTLFEIFLMIYVLYSCYSGKPNCIEELLNCVKWASYIISIYSFYYYGIDFLMEASFVVDRLDNSYANVNTIGMLAAIGIIIQIDSCFRSKKILGILLCIPSVILVALTQSRKALIALVLGGLLCVVLRSIEGKKSVRSAGRLMVIIPLAVVLLYGITSLPIFSGSMERMDAFIDGISGTGQFDSSSFVRNKMIEIGWDQFLETSAFGIGLGNSHLLTMRHLGINTYLHSNYIELLACGGLVGFLLHYSMYAYVLTIFIKHRNKKNSEYIICIVMLIILLMLDFAMVSYYSKIRYAYLLILFLEAERLKIKARSES